MSEEVSKLFVYMLLIAMIISGAANTLVYKYQNSQKINGVQFEHPYMQAVMMFVGEFVCIFAYIILQHKNQDTLKQQMVDAKKKGLQTKVNPIWLLIPASCDCCGSTLQYFALNFLNGSIYQMMRGGVIVLTAIFSVIFLKRKLQMHHIVGCVSAVIGITLVGVSNFIFGEASQYSTSEQIMAIILLIFSLFFNAAQFCIEEKLFSKFYLHPFQVVGTEGFWGLCLYAIILPMLSTIPCVQTLINNSACLQNGNNYYMENPGEYFWQFSQSFWLGFMIILGVLTIACFNVCGVSVTKYVSCLARSVVDVSRTVIVWGVGLGVTFGQCNQSDLQNCLYDWENTKGSAIGLEAAGFLILVFGTMLYNEIIILPFMKPQAKIEDDNLVSLQQNVITEDQTETPIEKTLLVKKGI